MARRRRIRRAARRAYSVGRAAASGFRGTAVAGGTGVAAEILYYEAASRSEFMRKNWWLGPAVMIGGGHFIKRKAPNVGVALCAVGGYTGAQGFRASRAAKKTEGETEAKGIVKPNQIRAAIKQELRQMGAGANSPEVPETSRARVPVYA